MNRFAWLTGCLLLLSVAQVAAAVSQPIRWRWSNPRPHGGTVVDMAYSSQYGLAVQVAERGQIFTSSDLNFWVPRDSGVTNDLRAVAFLGSRILVTGVNGRALYADALQPDVWKPATVTNTADWLEAVAASSLASLAVAVGDNGAVFTTATGTNWTKQATLTEWLRGVAWGNTTGSGPGVFVAVGENGRAFVSANGVAWTNRPTGTNANLNRVVFSALPTPRFIAVGENGACRVSFDNGTNWAAEVTGATNDLQHAVTAPHLTGGVRVAIGESEVRLTEFSGSWSNQLLSPSGPVPWTYYAGVGRLNSVFIVGQSGLMAEGIKTNGSPYAWTEKGSSIRNLLWDLAYVTNLYVTVGDRATVMTSINGVDWKPELVPDALTNSIFLGVGGNNDTLVAVGETGSLMVSPNVTNTSVTYTNGTNVITIETNASAFGVLWYPFPLSISNQLHGIAATTNFFVTTGSGGKIFHSRDATNWTAVTSPLPTRYLSGVTAWTNGWIATGDDGVILASVNGVNWSVVKNPNQLTPNWLYRVRHLGGRLIAVGQNGTIATSTNGSSWSLVAGTGTTNWLSDVACVGGTYFAVGFNGTVLISSNAVNWTNIGCLTRKDFFAAASDTRQLLLAGEEGAIVRAPIVPDTNLVGILDFDRFLLTNSSGGLVLENFYLFGGRTDQQFTVDSTTSIATNQWELGPKLEFFDSSGTILYLEMTPLTNAPPREFYRSPLVLPQ